MRSRVPSFEDKMFTKEVSAIVALLRFQQKKKGSVIKLSDCVDDAIVRITRTVVHECMLSSSIRWSIKIVSSDIAISLQAVGSVIAHLHASIALQDIQARSFPILTEKNLCMRST